MAPFLVFAVTALFQWVLLCIIPPENLSALATADAPYAQGMYLAEVTGFPLLLLCAGIAFGGDFSTLNASVAAPARYLFTMARDGVLPPCFAKLHRKYRTPWLAILLLGILMLLLVSTGSITYIASLSLFATLFYYIIGIAAAWGLRKKYPQLPRAYQAPKLHFGVPVSILLYLIMICQLQPTAILAGLLWSGFGLVLYFYHHKKGKAKQNPFVSLPPLPALPKSEERKQLNQTFRIWRNVTILAVILVLSLYLGAFLLGSFA